ncbi:hypothetical protein BO71DRAFT_183479 [Aspergillus ellipticus CBS 707.79]|uniref:Uncharacterized protein n=1 Tax=Aspergillus ellipticus CBS 707.79 TaxID=1448320 RepID=A0A319DGM2_9EURO|nr:hypothetical protein BO71DRAFT_183479 [Aspergillus ellipticus CBS 707.79]
MSMPSLIPKPVARSEHSAKEVASDLMTNDSGSVMSHAEVTGVVITSPFKGVKSGTDVGEASVAAISDMSQLNTDKQRDPEGPVSPVFEVDLPLVTTSGGSGVGATSPMPQLDNHGEYHASERPLSPGLGIDLLLATTPRDSDANFMSTAEGMPSSECVNEETPRPSNSTHERSNEEEMSASIPSTTSFSSASNRSLLNLDSSSPNKLTTVGESNLAASLKLAQSWPRLIMPSSPHKRLDGKEETFACDNDPSMHTRELCEPEFNITHGILSVKNPSNVRSGLYKLVVTVSVCLREGKQKEWNDLVIQGLPKLAVGESGFLLFRIPESYGLEFRTTNLQRHKIVENCFLAEFCHTRDLVVPIRRCPREFYGVVKDFTVNQEIRAAYVVSPSAEADRQNCQRELLVKYDLICSVKLHNHCFWAEKCCLFLSLDGGPERSFRCDLDKPDSHDSGVVIIDITANESAPIGSCNLQIVCSPRDLDMFCLNWKIKLPLKQATLWLPSVYPTPSSAGDRVSHRLRDMFLDLESRSRKFNKVTMTDPEGSTSKMAHDLVVDVSEEFPTWSIQQSEDFSECLPINVGSKRWDLTGKIAEMLLYVTYTMVLLSAFIWMNEVSFTAVTGPHQAISTITARELNDPTMNQSKIEHWCNYTGPSTVSWENEVEVGPEPTQESPTASAGLSEQGHIDVESSEADSKPDLPVTKDEPIIDPPIMEATLSFRDRVDYWLGWQGAMDSNRNGVHHNDGTGVRLQTS